jgi:hypothetical protein
LRLTITWATEQTLNIIFIITDNNGVPNHEDNTLSHILPQEYQESWFIPGNSELVNFSNIIPSPFLVYSWFIPDIPALKQKQQEYP